MRRGPPSHTARQIRRGAGRRWQFFFLAKRSSGSYPLLFSFVCLFFKWKTMAGKEPRLDFIRCSDRGVVAEIVSATKPLFGPSL